ncbi:MAG TPA: chromosomal replication initiator protein DnaA [Myxococcota bacterium]|nr:chromosomal replication initiator protein DnaA [Myxococcota bacterium]HRY92903.1 chromosomal replication initiator protein DnaA [Myxococcota bacterium]HSA20896.1 chromosomal replication initiator protein DnaA [Myxococcota bacterium]
MMQAEELWQSVLEHVERRVSPKNFTWFKMLNLVELDQGTAYLGVRDRFTRDWISDHGFKDIIQEELSSLLSAEIKVVLRLLEPGERPASEGAPAGAEEPAAPAASPVPAEPRPTEASRVMGLNPRYLFEHFVVGDSNQLAYAASINVAENPGSSYNPLFLYGGAGLGKTHLLNAIGHKILQDRPHTKIIYTTTERFVNEMINSIRSAKMEEFREKYRTNCDLLLIDDIQFISAKSRTQEEFFHTFNTLYESHRQIVITSDSYPQEIPELEDRLRTRFQWGLIADIQPPDIETRIAILQKKAESAGIDIPDDVAMYIASAARSNVREIEGAMKRLAALSSMKGTPITLEFAKGELKEVMSNSSPLSIEDVQKAVCNAFNVKLSDMKSKRRHRSISRPRQIAMYLCRTCLSATYPDIGSHFNKDHSTVITAVTNVDKLIASDPATKEKVEAIRRQLGL